MFRKLFNVLGIGVIIILLVVFFSVTTKYFFDIGNFLNILLQVSISTIIAIGMTVVILTGGIDLSVGPITALSGVIIALTLRVDGLPVWLCILFAMVFGMVSGTLMGMINGSLVVLGKVPAFIATLGMMSVARGLALLITKGQTINMLPNAYKPVTAGNLFTFTIAGTEYGFPVPVLYAAVVVIVISFLLNRTKFGRYIYAIGGNKEATRLSGVNTKLVEFSAFAISGLLCGIGAIVLVGRLNAGQPIAASGYELDAIAAAIIGGTSLSGGVGRISGTVMGALLMGVLSNGLNLLNVSTHLQQVITGLVIVAAVLFDQFRRWRRKNRAQPEVGSSA